jgi:hypothetical protein
MCLVAFIRSCAAIRDILIDTTTVRAARVFSTFVTIIAIYRSIFARVMIVITFIITNFSSTFIMIIAINGSVITTKVGFAGNRVTRTFVWTDISLIFTSTSRITSINGARIVIITVN